MNFVDGVPALTLNQALDNAALGFTTSGNSNWYPQTDTWTYGGSAARSGPIADSQSTSLQTTLRGPGTCRSGGRSPAKRAVISYRF